jgi:ADP-ribosylglycohydrolase/predicted enzyme related to lactoylglutathione lyase
MVNSTPRELILDRAAGAILGAAYGDALGWPNERSFSKKEPRGLHQELKNWTRRAGGRFYPHQELIKAGEYSDDTQLTLCLCRALQYDNRWWDRWTSVELPLWTLYERGGGGATKRSATAWGEGKSPWTVRNQKDIMRYFDAGGNGVAMRILPHVLCFAYSESFEPVAKNIVCDGITTHGHPRALVGALAYGYAIWKSLQRTARLEYGEIATDLLNNSKEWSILPDISKDHLDWVQAADDCLAGYKPSWESAVKEVISYLSICRHALEKGALAIDEEVLHNLHCFDPKISGAGTVAAAAAVYLASRYAPDPINGVIKAAFAIGSDTDTIASITGGLLGAVNGSIWLSSVKDKIQDSPYLIRSAQSLISKIEENKFYSDISRDSLRTSLKDWTEQLFNQPDSSEIFLPDGRKGIVYQIQDQPGSSGNYRVKFRKVLCNDGQTLYFTKVSRGNFRQSQQIKSKPVITGSLFQTTKEDIFGVKIPVESLDKARWFYVEIIGLKIKKQSQEAIIFEKGLVLVPNSYSVKNMNGTEFHALLYIEVTDIQSKYNLIKNAGLKIISPIRPWGESNRLFFRCSDPEGNILELFQAADMGMR